MGFYDILIENNSSKQIFILSGLTNISDSERYLQFEDVEIPESAKDGEYTYAVIWNGRNDVEYDIDNNLLDTVIHTEEGDVVLKDLHPITGILRIGTPESKIMYDDENNKKIYYYD